MIDFSKLIMSNYGKTKPKNRIYLNENTVLNISNVARPAHFALIGRSGEGKTWGDFMIMNQIENAFFLDPKGQARDILKEQGEKKNWKELFLTEAHVKRKKRLKINVRDIGIFGAKTFIPQSKGEANLRLPLLRFFGLKPSHPKKNFVGLKELLSNTAKGQELFEELSIIFSKRDEGIGVEDLSLQKTVVNVAGYDPENRSLGLLLGGFFDVRQRKGVLRKSKLLIGTDECDTFARNSSSIGKGLGFVFSFGRSFNLSGLVSGTVEGDLHKLIKGNISVYLIFDSPQEAEKFRRKYGVVVDENAMNLMRERYGRVGNCILKADSFGFGARAIHLNTYYQKIRVNTVKASDGVSNYRFSDERYIKQCLSY